MNLSRTVLGILLGIVAAVVWEVLGGQAVLWVVVLGAIGGLVGHILDDPSRLIGYLQRLER